MDMSAFNAEGLKSAAPMVFAVARSERSLEGMRRRLCTLSEQMEFDTFYEYGSFREGSIIRVRDCAHVFRNLMKKRSEDMAGFSVARAIRDTSLNRPRPDLSPAFYADLLHILLGLQGRGPGKAPADWDLEITQLEGREAARERSRQLDLLWSRTTDYLKRYPHGLQKNLIAYRQKRQHKIAKILGASAEDWNDWRWQTRNVIRDPKTLSKLITLSRDEKKAVEETCRQKIPFGITPYYLSLMDQKKSNRDQAIRAQVIPPLDYVRETAIARNSCTADLDFMRERDTSPEDLITRRYPAIVIFKPFNTCPQICVYCQRNWEIDDVLDPDALAPSEQVEKAIEWIQKHPAIHDVLLTGGDPLAMSDDHVQDFLERIAAIPSVERIRIGTRIPVTMPMRITEDLSKILGSFRVPGKREVVIVTHVQHPLEITPDTSQAIDRLRMHGLPVYNQLVFTFYISRRFEAAALRKLLRLVGITPYYTFNTKGKAETRAYRVPIARLLQEQKEDTRMLPGMVRTDEAVYNVPGMGKNYLRARQHRSILSILPDGARFYEYHPWEKNISGTGPLETFTTQDVPIMEYMMRLEEIGEDVSHYQTIWYYF